jgi:hypothetical protein
VGIRIKVIYERFLYFYKNRSYFLLTKFWYAGMIKENLIDCRITSYNLGDKAQKFLPSHRKWLDYEAVINREADSFLSSVNYVCLSHAPVEK